MGITNGLKGAGVGILYLILALFIPILNAPHGWIQSGFSSAGLNPLSFAALLLYWILIVGITFVIGFLIPN